MRNKLLDELNSFSRWFRWLFFVLFLVYIAFWLWTIYLADLQKKDNLEPVLPITPQDSIEYRNLAESIIENRSFSQNGYADTLRTPGYPFFLAILKSIGGSFFAATLVQIILVFASALIIRRLGTFFPSNGVGEIAVVFFLLNPLVLTLSMIVLTDVLFLFLLLLGFYLALMSHKTIPSSLVFATAIYIRPMGIFALPIFVIPFLASHVLLKEKVKSIVIMVVVVILSLIPWLYRNYKLSGVIGFTSFKAVNLAAYAVPMFLANENGTTITEERVYMEEKIGIKKSQWVDLRYSKEISTIAQSIIFEHPFEYFKYHTISSLPFLFSSHLQDAVATYKEAMYTESVFKPGIISYATTGQWKLFFANIPQVWWKMGERLIWGLIYIIATIGFWQCRRKILAWAFLFVPLYLMLLAGPAANARYAIQGLPFILVLFAVGAVYSYNKLFRGYKDVSLN